jgi:hypothetical protein
MVLTEGALRQQGFACRYRDLLSLVTLFEQGQETEKLRPDELGTRLVGGRQSLSHERQRLLPPPFEQRQFGEKRKNPSLVAARLQRARLLKRFRECVPDRVVASRSDQARPDRPQREHLLRVEVADPARGLQSLAHVVEPAVDIADIKAASTHHHPIGNRDAGQSIGVANVDAFGEITQRRRYSTIHELRVGKAAQCAGSPLRRIEAFGEAQGGRMRVAARVEFAASEMKISAQIVNLGKRAVVGARGRMRLGFVQSRKRVVDSREQAIGGRAADQRPSPVLFRPARVERASVGIERVETAPGIQLQVAELKSEIDPVAPLDGDREAPAGEGNGLVLAEQGRLVS